MNTRREAHEPVVYEGRRRSQAVYRRGVLCGRSLGVRVTWCNSAQMAERNRQVEERIELPSGFSGKEREARSWSWARREYQYRESELMTKKNSSGQVRSQQGRLV